MSEQIDPRDFPFFGQICICGHDAYEFHELLPDATAVTMVARCHAVGPQNIRCDCDEFVWDESDWEVSQELRNHA